MKMLTVQINRLGVTIAAFYLSACADGSIPRAFAAFQACQEELAAATSPADVSCVDPSAFKSDFVTPQWVLEDLQKSTQTPWVLIRGSIENGIANLRIISTKDPKPNRGYTAKMVRSENGRWLLRNVGVNILQGRDGSEFGSGDMQLRGVKHVVSNHVVSETTRLGENYLYGMYDMWGEVGITIQTKQGPLTTGVIEYAYVREAFSNPPIVVTITLGSYDDQQFSYKHGGHIRIDDDTNGLLQGSYDFWAEKRNGDRVELSGRFKDLSAISKNRNAL